MINPKDLEDGADYIVEFPFTGGSTVSAWSPGSRTAVG
jgi:hypothetical protein